MKDQKIAILVDNQYQVLELWYPYLRLREEGMETVLVAPETAEYHSKEGYPAKAEFPVEKARVEDFSGVIIPGGYAPDRLRRHPAITRFVGGMFESGKMVATICHGGWVAISAGILEGRKATSFMAIKDDMVNAGVEYLDEEVVVDENLITSRSPDDLPAFCREIIGFLNKKK